MNNSTPLISYSENYRANVRTTKGADILIRPLFAADLSALKEFFSSLSYKTVYYRFLFPIREFSGELLNRLIQVDYKKNIALAVFHRIDNQEKLVGVIRLFISEYYTSAEISLVVTDPWQGN